MCLKAFLLIYLDFLNIASSLESSSSISLHSASVCCTVKLHFDLSLCSTTKAVSMLVGTAWDIILHSLASHKSTQKSSGKRAEKERKPQANSMGNVYSPQHYTGAQDQNNSNNLRDNSNILNGGRPEGDLGLRADIASLLSFPYRTNFPAPSIHEATTVKALVNLNKDTLQLVRDESNPNHYHIKFVYDASYPCIIKVYSSAIDTISGYVF